MWDATWGVRDRDRSSDKYVGCHVGVRYETEAVTNMWDATWGVRDRDRSNDKYVGCHVGGEG